MLFWVFSWITASSSWEKKWFHFTVLFCCMRGVWSFFPCKNVIFSEVIFVSEYHDAAQFKGKNQKGKKGGTADQMQCDHRNLPLLVTTIYVNMPLIFSWIQLWFHHRGLWPSEDQHMSVVERFYPVKKVIGVHKYLFLCCVTNGRE